MVDRSRSHRFTPQRAVLALVCTLLAPLLGCEDGELSPLVSRDVFTLQYDDLTADNNCDSASNPGDFYISAELLDASLAFRNPMLDHAPTGLEIRLDRINERLVQTHTGTVPVGFGVEGEMLPPNEGDRLLVDLSFFEKDTAVYMTARNVIELVWGRDADTNERCWLRDDGRLDLRCFDANSAVADQTTGTVRLDDNGSSPCEATLRWTLTRTEELVPRPQLLTEVPRYAISGDIWVFERGDGAFRVCRTSFAVTVDPSKSRSVFGAGTCDGGTRWGEIAGTFEVRGRWDRDGRISGDIVFDMDGTLGTVQQAYPFVGFLDDQLIDFIFEGRATLDGREHVWFGTAEGEFLVPPAAG